MDQKGLLSERSELQTFPIFCHTQITLSQAGQIQIQIQLQFQK
jgi:hypothetical protein